MPDEPGVTLHAGVSAAQPSVLVLRVRDRDGQLLDDWVAEAAPPQRGQWEARLTLFGPDGTPIQDDSDRAARLAGLGSFLVDTGGRLGELFGVGALKAVARQDSRERFEIV